jgi:hypothetical protein
MSMTYTTSLFARVMGINGERFELSRTSNGDALVCSINPRDALTTELVLPLEALHALIAQIPLVFPSAPINPTQQQQQRRRRRAVPQEPSVEKVTRQRSEADGERVAGNIDPRTGEVIE